MSGGAVETKGNAFLTNKVISMSILFVCARSLMVLTSPLGRGGLKEVCGLRTKSSMFVGVWINMSVAVGLQKI